MLAALWRIDCIGAREGTRDQLGGNLVVKAREHVAWTRVLTLELGSHWLSVYSWYND